MTKLASGARTLWSIVWRVALFLLVWALLIGLMVVPFGQALSATADGPNPGLSLYVNVASIVSILAAIWLMTRFIDRRPFLRQALVSGRPAREAAAGLLIGCAWLWVCVGIAWVAGWVVGIAPAGFSWAAVPAAAFDVLLNVIAQQLLLCGYVFHIIRNRAGAQVAVFASALLFAGYHAGAFDAAWLPALNVALAGALFCLAYCVTGSLWLPVFIHFAWNFLLGPVLGLTVSGTGQLGQGWQLVAVNGPELFTGGAFGLEGGLIVTVVTASMVAAAWVAQRWRSPGAAAAPAADPAAG